MESRLKEVFDRVLSHLLYGGVWLLARIPYTMGQAMGRAVGKAVGLVTRGRFRVSLDGLRFAFGEDLKESELKALNRKVLQHFAQLVFEVPHILRLSPGNLDRYVVFENEGAFVSALNRGKGLLMLTGHFGNWELMSAAIVLRFEVNGAAVVRPIDFGPADALMKRLRSRFGLEIIPKKRAMKQLLIALRENKTIGILLDQNVDWYEGVFVPFLGHLACTNKGLALMAQRTGAPVVPTFSVRQSDGRYRIRFEPEVTLVNSGDKVRDLEENTALFNRIIESHVRQHPEQWFWFHRRWKTRPFCPLPEARSLGLNPVKTCQE